MHRRLALAVLATAASVAASPADAQLLGLGRGGGGGGALDTLLAPVGAVVKPVGAALQPVGQALAPIGGALAPVAPVLAPVTGVVDRVTALPVVTSVAGVVKPLVDPVVAPALPVPVLTTATPPAAAGGALTAALGSTTEGLVQTTAPLVGAVAGGLEAVVAPVASTALAPVGGTVGQATAPLVAPLHAVLAATESVLPGVEQFATPAPGVTLHSVVEADGSIALTAAAPPPAQTAADVAPGLAVAASAETAPDSRTELAAVAARMGARAERLPEGLAVRGQILAFAPTPVALQALTRRGFGVLSQDADVVVLSTPRGLGVASARRLVATLDPAGLYDANHLFVPAGAVAPTARKPAPRAPAPQAGGPAVMGLIDERVDPTNAALRGVDVRQARFGAAAAPHGHGLAVASLMVADGRRAGRTLYVADVYGPDGAADALSVARALAWMRRERVPVVNLSLVGPKNGLVAKTVADLLAGGALVVAAAGNDGPLAPPLYPAALPGVIAVTGVDGADRALPEAARGPHIDFAAPAAELTAAGRNGPVRVRGTSFAAPLVAARLAQRLPAPDAARAAQLVRAMERSARDLGAAGRDPVYGDGLVAEDTAAWTRRDARRLATASGRAR